MERMYAAWIPVRDLAASRAFYENIFGLTVTREDGPWIEFDTGETVFALLERRNRPGREKTRIMFEVRDIDAVARRLKRASVRTPGGIRVEPYGKLLTFEDPDGHWLELYEPAVPRTSDIR